MLDLTFVLDPQAGLVDWGAVSPPSAEAPWWTCVAHLVGAPDKPYGLVGAIATTRRAAMVRGAGEVVERSCLTAGQAYCAELPMPAPKPGAYRRELDLEGWVVPGWEGALVAAHDLVSGAVVEVPEVLLVDRDEEAHGATNFGPSGCAAGTSPEMAAAHALLEIVERDATIDAWSQLRPAIRLDIAHASQLGLVDRALVARVNAVCDAFDLTFAWSLLPALGGAVQVAFGALLDRGGSCRGIGMKSALSLPSALMGSFVESLQQFAVLRSESPRFNPQPSCDQERAGHFASPEGRAELSNWIDCWRPDPGWVPEQPVADLAALLLAIDAVGATPVAVELTPRLPEPVQAMGWTVVQCAILGLAPLTINAAADVAHVSAREPALNQAPHFMI
ncbi:MAG: YcaO-like family protein [Patulibacter sp.]